MNFTPIISVIVPIYRVEEYLPQCIESILAQTFTDFELLLIDDGSPDCCGKICEEYALKDMRIRVFHQENAGVSIARNKGLTEALGKYIMFVDSDDYVLPGYIQDLFNELPAKEVGVVIGSVIKLYPDGRMKPCDLPNLNLSSKDKYRVLTELTDKNIGYPHSKLYRMDVIKKHQLSFLSTVSLLEDLFFLLDYIQYADFVLVRNISNYVYRVGHSTNTLSICSKPLDEEYRVFQNYYRRIVCYQQKYCIQSDELKIVYGELKIFFHRTMIALYTHEHAQGHSFRMRLSFLKKVTINYLDWIIKDFVPDYLADRISKFLLVHRFYLCLDLWMRCLLAVNFQYMFGAKKTA